MKELDLSRTPEEIVADLEEMSVNELKGLIDELDYLMHQARCTKKAALIIGLRKTIEGPDAYIPEGETLQ